MKRRVRIIALFGLLLSLIASFAIIKNSVTKPSGLSIGYHLGDFSVGDTSGKRIKISQFAGRYIFLNLLDLNCSHCVSHLKSMKILSKCFAKEDLTFVAIAINKAKQISEFCQNNSIPFKIYHGSPTLIKKIFRERSLPTTYVIDATLTIRKRLTGNININDEFKVLNSLLKTNSAAVSKKEISEFFFFFFLGTEGVVFQQGQRDCGSAALKMIFDHYKIKASLEKISKLIVDNNGASMLRMKLLAEERGMRVSGWKLTPEDLVKIEKPLIAFILRNHYVVVSQASKSGVTVLDPSIGKLIYPLKKFQKIWQGEVLLFAPGKKNNNKHEI